MTNEKNKKNRLHAQPSVYTPEGGKLPPQAMELEEAVLGSMLLEKEAVATVIDILVMESFYKEQNGRVFNAIKTLFNRSEPVDILTVTHELKKTGELEIVGGAFYVSSLTTRVASSANIEYHARVISQKYMQRELIRIGVETVKLAYEESSDVFELLDDATKNIYQLVEGNARKQFKKISTLVGEAITEMEAAGNKEGLLGVPSGFSALDRVTGGWQKSDLLILAARPGMGKTALVAALAKNAAVEFNKPVVIFSLEMSGVQLTKRLISSETQIIQEKIIKGDLSNDEYVMMNERLTKLTRAPLYIDDTAALSLFELRAKARRMKENEKIELIIVDYLQLMTSGTDYKGFRELEISSISRGLKGLAKELEIPIIALSQLSREVEKRTVGNKKPQLSDLRESGAIEQDADMVMFIYRPEYYGMENDSVGNDLRGETEIIIAKNRHGAITSVYLKWIAQYMQFADKSDLTFEDKVAGIQQNTSREDNF